MAKARFTKEDVISMVREALKDVHLSARYAST